MSANNWPPRGGNAADALQNVPSVQVDGDGNVMLRGSADFTLLIDGRPAIIEAAEALKSIPAGSIQSIEIITNPSVKYEAQGNTGIINIISKKEHLKGMDGLLNLSLATEDKYRGSLMLNRNYKKLRAYVGLSSSYQTKRNKSWETRDVDASEPYQEYIYSFRKVRRTRNEIKAGTDFFLNKKNTLSLSGQFGKWEFERLINSDYNLTFMPKPKPDSLIHTIEDFKTVNDYAAANLHYKLDLDEAGQGLEFDYFYAYTDNQSPNTYEEAQTHYNQHISNSSIRKRHRATLDYSLPFKEKYALETGVFSEMDASKYNYQFSWQKAPNPEWVINPDLSGTMDFDHQLYAAYLSFSAKFKAFEVQAGLRAESADRNLNVPAKDYHFDQLDLFPSLHFSKSIKKTHNLGLSYSRRVNRPSEWQLSPVLYSSDRFFNKMGNPSLKPSFTNSFEFTYYIRKKTISFNSTLFYRHEKDFISSFVVLGDEGFVETYDNLDKQVNSGIEFFVRYNPVKLLDFNLSVNAYYSEWDGEIANGGKLNGEAMLSNGRLMTTLKITKKTTFQFLCIYYAPGDVPQGHANAFYYFDFFLKQKLCNDRLNITARTHNTFDTGLYKYTVADSNYHTYGKYRYEGPTLILSLSFKLNNYKRQNTGKEIGQGFDSGLDH
jgi:outer membrane receptor protein involved in Fe transport